MTTTSTSSYAAQIDRGVMVGLTLHYRDADTTERCLRSLLDEGLHHVLVWDNSEDNGYSGSMLMSRFESENRVSVVVSPVNLGFAIGVNAGMRWLSKRFPGGCVLLINNDACLLPGAARELYQAFFSKPDVKLVYPRIQQGPTSADTKYYHRWLALQSARKWPGSFIYPNGCCLLLTADERRQPWFDEDYFMYGEDTLLGWRFRADLGQIIGLEKTLVSHEGAASSGAGSLFYESRMVAAHLIFVRKTASTRLEGLCMMVGRACTLPLRAVVRAIRHCSMVPIQALLEGARIAYGRDPMLERARSRTSD